MADATQGNTDLQYLGLLIPALITLIPGLLVHSFIIGVNVSDWWKGRSVTAVDQVITSLGISRMCAQFINSLYLDFIRVFLRNVDRHVTLVIGSIFDLFTFANFWLTSLLSIVFCLKISTFHSRLFLYLRGMIIHRTGYLIVASGLLSTLACLMLLTISITKLIKVFLFVSLYNHTRNMRNRNLSINLEAYYSAMKFISFTFLYNTVYLISHDTAVIYYYIYCVEVDWLHIVLEFLPVLHSSYLIYRTAKLKSQMSKVLQNVMDFFFQRKDTETRENIEIVAQ
ncbi:hypothetical protein PRIEUP_LOCUS95 [Pristimantis euphronides]